MRSILDRYLIREVLWTWLAVTGVLLFILLSNQFARVLGDAAAGKLPRDAVFSLIGLSSITYLTLLVPLGLFLAVMLALGRFYKDSEMAAISACGVSPTQLYRPLLWLAGVIAAVLGWLSLEAGPWAARQANRIAEDARRQMEIGAMEPGRFRSGGSNDLVFYAERVDEQGTLRNVFLQRRLGDRVELAVAARAVQRTSPVTGDLNLVLFDGRRYEGVPGTVRFRIVRFAEHGIPIRVAARGEDSASPELAPTEVLLGSATPADAAELHWRISAPVVALLLTVVAVPLSRTSPRQGRYGKLALAVVFYIFYANLLGVARVAIEQGRLSPAIGMWPVHVLVLGLAVVLLWRQLRLPAARAAAAAA